MENVRNSLAKLYEDCQEEQDEVFECSLDLDLLGQMIEQNGSAMQDSFQRAKNVLNSSRLTSKFD